MWDKIFSDWIFVFWQRLHEAFKENQYPERAASDKLAEELGITTQQVSLSFTHNIDSFFISF